MQDKEIREKFNQYDRQFISIDERFDRVEALLEEVPTRDEVLTKLDAIMKIILQTDQELKFTGPRFERIEKHVGLSPA